MLRRFRKPRQIPELSTRGKTLVERVIAIRQWEDANLLWDVIVDLGFADESDHGRVFEDVDRILDMARAVEIIRCEVDDADAA